MTDDGRQPAGKLGIKSTDGIVLAALALVTLLTVLFHRRVAGWGFLVLRNFGAATAYLAILLVSGRSKDRLRRFFIRLAGILFIFSYINLAVARLQLIIYGRWLDDSVLRLENALFGA